MSEGDFCFGILIGAVLASVIILIFGGIFSDVSSVKYVDVNSNVRDVVLHDTYMTVTFDNNQSYNIIFNSNSGSSANNIVDFDNGAHVLVRLRWSQGWFNQNNDDCWRIVQLVKY